MPKKTSTKRDKGNATRVAATQHGKQTRPNIPTAEMEAMVPENQTKPITAFYARNQDVDPQLMWQGKDGENAERLRVDAMPIYVQEKIKPLAIVEDLRRHTATDREAKGEIDKNLFGDFNGLPEQARVEFYQHAQKWTNRMILGDSLLVMASLAHKEGLKGKVQCIYMDPPYGIKFASNWQPSTKSTAVGDKDQTHEPEMIQAFRDTWKNGIHSYLSYLRDRLIVARDLMTESGSVFVQISDENIHFVRCLMDEIFGRENFVRQISFRKSSPLSSKELPGVHDIIIWYAKNKESKKSHHLYINKNFLSSWFSLAQLENGKIKSVKNLTEEEIQNPEIKYIATADLKSSGYGESCTYDFDFHGRVIPFQKKSWRTHRSGMARLIMADRLYETGGEIPRFKQHYNDFSMQLLDNMWNDTSAASNMVYVVQTNEQVIQRCILMTTDPGDLVLDPTCGSGSTAFVAEKWGRRWITTDTSRVALALARARIMGARYPYYLMQDSKEGAEKEAAISGKPIAQKTFGDDVRHGFVYKRVPHITLGDIANNKAIDSIWARWQEKLEPLRAKLNELCGETWEEWQIPIEPATDWSAKSKQTHAQWQNTRHRRQQEIDAAIAHHAKSEYLVDRPYEASNAVRVSGAFTMESLSPHRVVPPESAHQTPTTRPKSECDHEVRFLEVVRENLANAGVGNTHKDEKLEFTDVDIWEGGRHIQFAGKYEDKNGKEKRVAICVGPEYGTVSRQLVREAAKEAADMFDLLVVLGFAFDALSDGSMMNIGRMRVIRARMHNDLHMADRLSADSKKSTANLFVSFGEPDLELREVGDGLYEVEIRGVDIFNPRTGEVKVSESVDIACWLVDTDYNGESFFVRHAYFCGGDKDPYKSLKGALRADISEEAWASLRCTVSRPFPKPQTGRIAVKAINHYGDEVIKVLEVGGTKKD